MPRVFISHSSLDRQFVDRDLMPVLREAGIDTWYATNDIATAVEWERSIRDGLNSCDWFIVVLSPEAIESEWVRTEVHWAMENRAGRVVPLVLRPCNPTELHLKLGRIQFLDCTSGIVRIKDRLLETWGLSPTVQAAPDEKNHPCRHCGAENSPEAVYCIACGGAVQIPCTHCEQMNPANATHCSRCGKNLDDFEQAQQVLEQAFTALRNGDHVTALETAGQGLKQFHSLATEFDETRRKAQDIIAANREEILQLLKDVHDHLTHKNHPAAGAVMETAVMRIDRERGAEDMRPKVDQLRDVMQRIAADHEQRKKKAASLIGEGRWRDAAAHVQAMIGDYAWDESLPDQLSDIRRNMGETDGYASDVQHALTQRDFETALDRCAMIRRIEPDHPQLESFEQQARSDEKLFRKHIQRVHEMQSKGQLSAARAQLAATVEEFPCNKQAARMLDLTDKRVAAIELLEEARRGGSAPRALRAWQTIAEMQPDDQEAQEALATLQPLVGATRQSQALKATLSIGTVVIIVGVGAAMWVMHSLNSSRLAQARTLADQGEFQKAGDELAAMLPLFKGGQADASAYIEKQRARFAANDTKVAMTKAKQAALVAPLTRQALMDQADLAADKAQSAAAAEDWRTADASSRDAARLYRLAPAAGEYDAASKDVDMALLNEHGSEHWRKIVSLTTPQSDAAAWRQAASLLPAAVKQAMQNRREKGIASAKPAEQTAMKARQTAVDAKAVDLAPYLFNKAEDQADGARQLVKLEQFADAIEHWRTTEHAYRAAAAHASCEDALSRIDIEKLDAANTDAWQRAKAAKTAADAAEDDYRQIAKLYRRAIELIQEAAN